MHTTSEELRDRTRKFALRIIRLFQALPRSGETQIIGKQLLRSGTSVAANYRAACRARSQAEFIARIGVVAEEADETVFWIELLTEAKLLASSSTHALLTEAKELAAIFTASEHTAKANARPKKFRSSAVPQFRNREGRQVQ